MTVVVDRDREDSSAKARTAPAPEDNRKPDTPLQVREPARRYSLKRTLREFGKDQCPDLAAALTYHAVLSVFPTLLALVSLLGLVGQADKTTAALLGMVQKVAPGSVDIIKGPIEQITHAQSAGFALVIGILVALFSASGYVGAFSRAMNRIYQIDEGRPLWKLRPTMLAVTLVAVILVAAMALMLIVSGPVAQAVGDALGVGDAGLLVWNIVKWPVIVLLVIVVIAILYYATPNVKQPKFRWISIGSLISPLVFVLVSLAFGFYVANFGHYDKTYGTIGGAIVLLLWLRILNMSLLFGAEFDAEVERGRELQGGIEAEETIQLPPRDTKRSDKLHEQEQEEIARGRVLREESGPPEKPEHRFLILTFDGSAVGRSPHCLIRVHIARMEDSYQPDPCVSKYTDDQDLGRGVAVVRRCRESPGGILLQQRPKQRGQTPQTPKWRHARHLAGAINSRYGSHDGAGSGELQRRKNYEYPESS